jgi:hypothetical protein
LLFWSGFQFKHCRVLLHIGLHCNLGWNHDCIRECSLPSVPVVLSFQGYTSALIMLGLSGLRVRYACHPDYRRISKLQQSSEKRKDQRHHPKSSQDIDMKRYVLEPQLATIAPGEPFSNESLFPIATVIEVCQI